MSIVEARKKRIENLEQLLDESRKEIARLTKINQKLYSNVSKMGLEETSVECVCASPSKVPNKSTSSGFICLNCAGY